MIDEEGYRLNVGIILTNNEGKVFLGKRVNQAAWQFPQGGIASGETPEQAMYRELHEEIGLKTTDVKILATTEKWLRYQLPEKYIRRGQTPVCLGQKQKWFLLSLISDETCINLTKTPTPEFDRWEWVFYWAPVKKVIHFKRRVYIKALKLLRPYLNTA